MFHFHITLICIVEFEMKLGEDDRNRDIKLSLSQAIKQHCALVLNTEVDEY